MRAFIFLLLLGLLGAGCETTKPKPETQNVHRGASFEMQIPADASVFVDQGDGFAVHYVRVSKDGKAKLGIYEGQRPQLFSKKENNLTAMRHTALNRENIQGDDVWGVDSNALNWRESIWNCQRIIHGKNGKTFRLPTMLHIWYFDATDEEQTAFDAMINSIEMLK
ncbi:MAG: hypothetical protein PHV34_19485 [Verrucomicrobiae bacterium]|nr:hypothetical protein [Verrucomicrobiae bacterium]